MDFEDRNFGLTFARVTLQKKSWPLVDLFGDDSIAQKRGANVRGAIIRGQLSRGQLSCSRYNKRFISDTV